MKHGKAHRTKEEKEGHDKGTMIAQTQLAKEGADADGRQRSVAKSLNLQTAEEGDTGVDGVCPHFHVQIKVCKTEMRLYRGRKVTAICEVESVRTCDVECAASIHRSLECAVGRGYFRQLDWQNYGVVHKIKMFWIRQGGDWVVSL